MLRPIRLIAGLVLVLAVPVLHAQEPAAKAWQAGVAKVVITPAQPMWMSGYASRTKPAEGKLHDLWAKAVVLQDAGGKQCVLITLDLVGINRELSQAVCAEISQRCKIPRAGIRLAISHTHCGPVVGKNLRSMYVLDEQQQKLVDDYTRDLHKKLVALVEAALKDLAPAQLSWGDGLVTLATNRRNNKETDVPALRQRGQLKGPVDHQVPVLAVRDPQGKLRAIVFGYACHATVLSFYQWCGDYPGFAQLELEKNHPGAVALFWAGCGGDQNPLPRRTVTLAEEYGRRLAQGVDEVLNAPMQSVSPTLEMKYMEIPLALADLPSREILAKNLNNPNRYIAARARLLLDKWNKEGTLAQTYPYPVQVWQLGTLTWVALGGEVVVEYALRLKRELGPLWVTGYANDVMAYIPSLRVLKEGGYEGATSMIYYGLPAVWSPRVEEQIITAVREQVKAVRK